MVAGKVDTAIKGRDGDKESTQTGASAERAGDREPAGDRAQDRRDAFARDGAIRKQEREPKNEA